MKLFRAQIKPSERDLMIDVGGYPDNWVQAPQTVARIDCVNLHAYPWKPEAFPQHKVQTLIGDGCQLAFADHAYDIAYSNSVIEHVGGFSEQQRFAKEIRRVGRRLWVQTPAYHCPIEPHFLMPFAHWLPASVRPMIVRWLSPWGWLTRPTKERAANMVRSTQLLTKTQMQQLFPDCRIVTERLFGIFPKSYIAIRNS